MTQVLFAALTWRFTIVLILVPGNLMPSFLAPGMHMMHTYAGKQSYTNEKNRTVNASNPSTQGIEFKVILSYVGRSRPAKDV